MIMLVFLNLTVQAWQLIQANGVYMIDALIEDRNIQFFKLYQSFENLEFLNQLGKKIY